MMKENETAVNRLLLAARDFVATTPVPFLCSTPTFCAEWPFGRVYVQSRRIRWHWPQTRITIGVTGNYGRREVIGWCDENAVKYIGHAVLDRAVDETADDIRTRRALSQELCLRDFVEKAIGRNPLKTDRRACARIEATPRCLGIRFVHTGMKTGWAEHIYETLYYARGIPGKERLIFRHRAIEPLSR
jgi:hypothetical protein